MLGMEGPIPGGPLGKRPRALRLSPGIRLDCSCRERGEESEKVILRKEENTELFLCIRLSFFLLQCLEIVTTKEQKNDWNRT